jgi:MOSC domain-containing protein YiiM
MQKGKVVSIFISSVKGQAMQSIREAHLVPGKGLEGDRYFIRAGTFSEKPGGGREVTLIEMEALESLKAQGLALEPGDARRNLVTRGVLLNDLVGRQFKVGEVTLKGVRLCEPCDYLAKMTSPEVLKGLLHRGGLRADIIQEGTIHLGDEVHEV